MQQYTTAKFINTGITFDPHEQSIDGIAEVGPHYIQNRYPFWFEQKARLLQKTNRELRELCDHSGTIDGVWAYYGDDSIRWWDHAGLLRMKDKKWNKSRQILIVEPYGISGDSLPSIIRFASDFNARIQIEAAGSHYPTLTVRIYFFNRDDEKDV